MIVNGTLEWTGLVIVAGCDPGMLIHDGADATIVGSLFGEDSVQSGDELSLDSAAIILRVDDDFRVLFSRQLFETGGLVHELLPEVMTTVTSVTPIGE